MMFIYFLSITAVCFGFMEQPNFNFRNFPTSLVKEYDIETGNQILEAVVLDDESSYSETNSNIYLEIGTMGPSLNFKTNEEIEIAPRTPIPPSKEYIEWLNRQYEKHPALSKNIEYSISVIIKIPKNKNISNCDVPDVCQVIVHNSYGIGNIFLIATGGILKVSNSEKKYKIQGNINLRAIAINFKIQSTNCYYLEFSNVMLKQGPDLLEKWKNGFLKNHQLLELQEWLKAEGRLD